MPPRTRFESLLTALAKEKSCNRIRQLAKVSDAIAALGGVGEAYQRRQAFPESEDCRQKGRENDRRAAEGCVRAHEAILGREPQSQEAVRPKLNLNWRTIIGPPAAVGHLNGFYRSGPDSESWAVRLRRDDQLWPPDTRSTLSHESKFAPTPWAPFYPDIHRPVIQRLSPPEVEIKTAVTLEHIFYETQTAFHLESRISVRPHAFYCFSNTVVLFTFWP